MRRTVMLPGLLAIVFTSVALVAQQAQSPAAPPRHPSPSGMSQTTLDEMLIRFPLPRGQEADADIDGRQMHKGVIEQVEMARRYRDQGHPKFWGRIIGTSADAESAQWLAGKLKAAGVTDVRIQPLDLVPQWFPLSWDVAIACGGSSIVLDSAQPHYGTVATPPDGLELDAVYVGLGSEADFAGRDVKGKAVFVLTMLGAPTENAVRRAADKGAAAIFEVNMLPGNARYQAYPLRSAAPAFTVGHDDGHAAREIIAAMPAGQSARVKVTLNVERVPNLTTALVWGTLPGATDETIYLMAHRDGWFDAAGDSASGVASMIALAEHFGRIPRARRKRTIVFIGLDGHHNSGEGSAVGNAWITANRQKLFAKTALAINVEHPSTIQTQSRPRYYNANEIVWGNTFMPQQWYAGGPSRPELEKITTAAFKAAFPNTWPQPYPQRKGSV